MFALLWPAIAAMFGTVFFAIWVKDRSRSSSLGFALGFSLLFLAMFMYIGFPTLRGPAVNAVSHLIACASVGYLAWGVCRRLGQAIPVPALVIVSLISTAIAVLASEFGQEPLSVTVQHNSSGILFLISAICVWFSRPVGWLDKSVIWIFGVLGASGLVRPALIEIVDGSAYNGDLTAHSWLAEATAMTPMIMTVALGAVLITLTLKDMQRELGERTNIDPISSFYDRPTFDRLCAEKLQDCRRLQLKVSLIVFEINRLGEIREEWGDDVGDTFFSTAAEVLRDIRREGDIAGRIGENQFGIFIVGVGAQSASKFACDFRERMRQKFTDSAASRFRLGPLCGVVDQQGEESFEQLSRRAQESVKHSRQSRENHIYINGINESSLGDSVRDDALE